MWFWKRTLRSSRAARPSTRAGAKTGAVSTSDIAGRETRQSPSMGSRKTQTQGGRSKHQDPRSREDPNTKIQSRRGTVLGSWNLEFGASLDLGSWCLDLRRLDARFISMAVGPWGIILPARPQLTQRYSRGY